MNNVYRILHGSGLLMIAILYLWLGAFDKLVDWNGTVGYIAHKGLPWPWTAAAGAVAVELFAPLAMFTRQWRTPALLILALYTIFTALLFHDFWKGDDAAHSQLQNFFKNMAIAGGMFCMVAQRSLAMASGNEPLRGSTATAGRRSPSQ